MTAHRIVEIRCDGPSAALPCPHAAAATGTVTADEVRGRLARKGWLYLFDGTGRDRCPTCAARATTHHPV